MKTKSIIILLPCIFITIQACIVTEQRVEHLTPAATVKTTKAMATLKVRVVVDESHVKSQSGYSSERNKWKEAARERTMDLSQYFENEFAIRLNILSVDIWEHGQNVAEYLPLNGRTARTLLFKDLRTLPLNNADLVIGISVSDVGGMVEYKGKYMLVGTPGHFRNNKRGSRSLRGRSDYANNTHYLDRHELGHIFGLDDKDYGPGSIMKPDSRKTEFNEFEKKIILENKLERFGIN